MTTLLRKEQGKNTGRRENERLYRYGCLFRYGDGNRISNAICDFKYYNIRS